MSDKTVIKVTLPKAMRKRMLLASARFGNCNLTSLARGYITTGLDMAKIPQVPK